MRDQQNKDVSNTKNNSNLESAFVIPFKRGSTFFSQLSLIEQEAKIGMTDMTESGHMGSWSVKILQSCYQNTGHERQLVHFQTYLLIVNVQKMQFLLSDEK